MQLANFRKYGDMSSKPVALLFFKELIVSVISFEVVEVKNIEDETGFFK